MAFAAAGSPRRMSRARGEALIRSGPWVPLMRFRDLDQAARLTLAGSLAAVVSFFLPWFQVRLNLQFIDVTGLGAATAPLLLRQIGTPAGAVESLLLALFGAVALLCALGSLLLILAPGLSTMREMNPKAGVRLAAVGLVCTVLAIVVMAAMVGPQVGITTITYGSLLALLGFALATWAWPRARRLGDEEEHHEPAPPPPQAGA